LMACHWRCSEMTPPPNTAGGGLANALAGSGC
jgi:hypothetical protein